MKKDVIYIFLHIPKTGGITLRCHIENNFKNDEILFLYFRPTAQIKYHFKNKDEIYKHLHNLTNEQKKKIKIIFGHVVCYGIHKFFNKEPRYLLFLRNPIARTISHYNSLVWSLFKKETPPSRLKDTREAVLENDKVISFHRFIESNKLAENYMVKFLMKGLSDENIDKIADSELEEIKRYLEKFYFIGINENPEDFLFFYYLLGINKFYCNQNISKKYISSKVNNKIKEKVRIKNALDAELYKYGLKLNRRFKENKSDFYNIILGMRIKRTLILPFTSTEYNIMQGIYKISFRLKQKFKIYPKFINFIKRK